ncbi:MAG TPA: hypothetical protein VL201_05785 [Patescibacteria group bacterium]|jgi:hypothetical protein|nr:hypothetical protein [Patescibacteria group bacterium]
MVSKFFMMGKFFKSVVFLYMLGMHFLQGTYVANILPKPYLLPKVLEASVGYTGLVRPFTTEDVYKAREHVNKQLNNFYDTFSRENRFKDPQDILELIQDKKNTILQSFSFNKSGDITLKQFEDLAVKCNMEEPVGHEIEIDKATPSSIRDLCKILHYHTKKRYGHAPVIDCITPADTSGAENPAFVYTMSQAALSNAGVIRLFLLDDQRELLAKTKDKDSSYEIHLTNASPEYHTIPMYAHEYGHAAKAHSYKKMFLRASMFNQLKNKTDFRTIIPRLLEFKKDANQLTAMKRLHEIEADTFYLNLPKQLALPVSQMHVKMMHDYLTYQQMTKSMFANKTIEVTTSPRDPYPSFAERILYALKAYELLSSSMNEN